MSRKHTLLLAISLLSLTVSPAKAAVFTVNSTGDASDPVPGNGVCGPSGGPCTLRAAIEEANALASDDEIGFNIPLAQPGCDAGTGACTINLTRELEPETQGGNLTITGPGADKLALRCPFRILLVRTTLSVTVTVSGLTISDGSEPSGSGAGILNANSGTVNVIRSVIARNSANSGGGVANTGPGTINVTNSVILDNRATGSNARGGGIANLGNGTINVTNSVVFRNTSFQTQTAGLAGGIFNESGTLNITNSTITGNTSGNTVGTGVRGPARVKSTIIALNPNQDVFGPHVSDGFNLIGLRTDNTTYTQPTDRTEIDPKFEAANVAVFGVMMPILPRCGSPALDQGTSAGLTGALPTDIRGAGFARTVDDPNVPNAADGTEIGAIERAACPQFTFVVNTTGDADDASPGDTACDSDAAAAGAQCTLRAALTEANALAGNQTITFAIPTSDPGFDSASGRHTINLTGALPAVALNNLTIAGPGAEKLTVRRSSGGAYRIFSIDTETLAISGLTISNGVSTEAGAILATGVVSLTDVTISDNSVTGGGGGVMIFSGTLNVSNCTFNDNSAGEDGGAISCRGTLNVTGSQFIDNFAAMRGGAISVNPFSANSVAIGGSIFIGNVAQEGGGAALGGSTMRVSDSIFRSNASTFALGGGGIYQDLGPLEITGSSLTDNTGGGLVTEGGNIVTTSVLESTLANNGGAGIVTRLAGNLGTILTVVNSTISGSRSSEPAGGYGIGVGRGTLNVTNSTVTGNERGGIVLSSGPVMNPGTWTVKSSLIALNGSVPDVNGVFTSAGFNLIGNPGSSTGFTDGVNNDQVGSAASPLNPRLDPAGLKDNGGATLTIGLLGDSPAIDKGSAAGLTGPLSTDQRGAGFARTFDNGQIAPPSGGDNTDIGAFEVQSTPTPTPVTTLANISTRLRVETGDNVLIGGFIITGTEPKKVIIRAIGTSLPLADKLANPALELHGPNGLIEANDNWVDSPNKQAIIDSTIPPSSDFEAAIVQMLPANNAGYTAIVRGVNNSTGIGVVEAYDLDTTVNSRLANISTRGFVQTGDNVLIAGTIVVGQAPQRVLLRAIGPSLPIAGVMANPTLELRDSSGTLLQANDNWVDSPDKQAIIATTIPPTNDLESAIVAILPANNASYTAIVRGVNDTTGIAVVEVYALP